MFELATPQFRSRGARVSVTKYRFLQQLLALELRGFTPDCLHRSLEKPSEPLRASTVCGIYTATAVAKEYDVAHDSHEIMGHISCSQDTTKGWRMMHQLTS